MGRTGRPTVAVSAIDVAEVAPQVAAERRMATVLAMDMDDIRSGGCALWSATGPMAMRKGRV